jgi:hypothetical protein
MDPDPAIFVIDLQFFYTIFFIFCVTVPLNNYPPFAVAAGVRRGRGLTRSCVSGGSNPRHRQRKFNQKYEFHNSLYDDVFVLC